MSAAKVDEATTKSSADKLNRRDLEILTNVLFLRNREDKISPFIKSQKKTQKDVKLDKTCEAHLIGTIEEGTPTSRAAWRILGMRMKRADAVTTDYDVYRMNSVREVNGVKISERIPNEKREGILRLLRFTSDQDVKLFQHEYHMFKMLAESYPSASHQTHYPAILGQGCLTELRYLNVSDCSKQKDKAEASQIPRPFFIIESFEPTLECLFKSNRNKSLSVHISVFAVVGCIKALRLLHMKGFVHRNVQPAYFSIRFPCSGLLSRKESELCDLVAITELWSCRRYRVNIPRSRTTLSYVGNWKYGSIETLTGKAPTVADDLISCIYMLTEFALGQIPWHECTEKQAILNKKKETEALDRLEDEKKVPLLNGYKKIYSWIKSQPPLQTVEYEALYEELLRMIDANAPPNANDQSMFGFSNPLVDAYEHGFVEKKAGKDKKTKVKDTSKRKKRKKDKCSSRHSVVKSVSLDGPKRSGGAGSPGRKGTASVSRDAEELADGKKSQNADEKRTNSKVDRKTPSSNREKKKAASSNKEKKKTGSSNKEKKKAKSNVDIKVRSKEKAEKNAKSKGKDGKKVVSKSNEQLKKTQ
ncbi:hypothetical protein Q1695_005607 [Nippostrongylus brasiliensis]|nr:hypothetical protein Q1695_005607 [Nippostrongylus brasiliensis]